MEGNVKSGNYLNMIVLIFLLMGTHKLDCESIISQEKNEMIKISWNTSTEKLFVYEDNVKKVDFPKKSNIYNRGVCIHDHTNLNVEWYAQKIKMIYDKFYLYVYLEKSIGKLEKVDECPHMKSFPRKTFTHKNYGNSYIIEVYLMAGSKLLMQIYKIRCIKVPKPPSKIYVDQDNLNSSSFMVRWNPPDNFNKFDGYEIFFNETVKLFKKQDSNFMKFSEGILPGHSYEVKIATKFEKQLSGNLTCLITTRPLPVFKLNATSAKNGIILVEWKTDPESSQQYYNVVYKIIGQNIGESKVAANKSTILTNLLPGYNYLVEVYAISNNIPSIPTTIEVYSLGHLPDFYFAKHVVPSILQSQIGFPNSTSKSMVVTNQSSTIVSRVQEVQSTEIPRQRNVKINFENLSIIIINTIIVLIVIIAIGYKLFKYISKHSFSIYQDNFGTYDRQTSLVFKKESEKIRFLTDFQDDFQIKRCQLKIKCYLGVGNFGVVYFGSYKTNNNLDETLVAIKELNIVRAKIDLDNFLQEAKIMKDFKHENVLNLIGVSVETNGSPLVVLPFMANGDLLKYLRDARNGPDVKQLLKFALDVAKGMDYVSKLNLVHRDLAARNCLLDKDLCVKVADFGLTRDIYEKNYYRIKNKNLGLPIRWMSLESIDLGVFTIESDVWSFGVLLWEILTRGLLPYSNFDNSSILSHLKKGFRLYKPSYCPKLIYEMQCLCWSIEPSNRPTFAQLANRLNEILIDHTILNIANNVYYNKPIIFSARSE